MPESPEWLFVYGTLRPGVSGTAGELVAGLETVGGAVVRGLLFDLGDYPGMIDGEGAVHGELLLVRDSSRLAVLDDYEGCGEARPLFRRRRATARRETGEEISVWAYFYAGSVVGAVRIPGGDYAAHRRVS